MMWKKVLSFLALFSGLLAPSLAAPALAEPHCAEPGKAKLAITVTNLRNDKGAVIVNLFGDEPEDFLKSGTRLARVRVPAVHHTVIACVDLPKPGFYAISVYHDEDNNKKITRNLVGMPTEGYGFSNDAPVSLMPPGPPKFADARFEAGGGTTPLKITMRY